MRPTAPLLLLLGLLFAAACAGRQEPVAAPTTVDRAAYPRMFESAVQTLRRHGFTVNRMDFRFGRINTYPRTAPTVFEPFRPGYGTPTSALESTWNDQRRIVNVFFEAAEQPVDAEAAGDRPEAAEQLHMRVEVVVERRQVPGRQLTGAAQGFDVLADLDQTPAELVERGIEGPYWQAVRRDIEFEQKLLSRIVRRAPDVKLPGERARR